MNDNKKRDANPDPITGEPGAHPVGVGAGATGGAVTGAAIGAVGGPIGSAVGGAIGAVAGGLAGKGVAEAVDPTDPTATPGVTHASEMSSTSMAGDTTARKTDAVWEQAKGNWHQFKGSVKAKWNDLTDDEIDQMDGHRERIVGKIQERYGKAKWSEADIENELRRR